ncbi:hypothetical protein GC176_07000 [bacterium]|nr:hypothetical protein [bacterium]
MTNSTYSCPRTRMQVINAYFLEHRAKLLDIAAYLDRLDRAQPDSDETDFRDVAFTRCLAVLTDGQPQRARRVLELLSDHSTDMPQSAEGMKGASGAPQSIVASAVAGAEGGSL